MFSDRQKKEYSETKAPEQLRERVLASVDEQSSERVFKSQFSRIIAAAACMVLIAVAAFTVFTGNNIDVSVNGQAVEKGGSVAPYQSRTLARTGETEVELELRINSDALITVENGSFDIIGEGENFTEFSAEGDVKLIWRSNGQQKSTMTVDYGRKTCVLILECNGEWTVKYAE